MQLVAGLVAERVVDRLEVVHVEVEQRDRAALLPCGLDRGVQPLGEPVAVEQAGEVVVGGRVGQLALAVVTGRDVGGEAGDRVLALAG